MRNTLFIVLFLLPVFTIAQKKVEFRGLYVGAQTISTIKPKQQFQHSAYLIGLVGYRRVTFNTQWIVPIKNTTLIKFGIDYKLW